uniref:Uncharacterized protein n=1 Tax=Arundo donax TaxID=35708 RepID=A0A0A9F965_ARUDO
MKEHAICCSLRVDSMSRKNFYAARVIFSIRLTKMQMIARS